MLDELRNRVILFLAQNHICMVATNGTECATAIQLQYESDGLILNCRLPRWSDTYYYIVQEQRVIAIIPELQSNSTRWLQYRGTALINDTHDLSYVTIQLKPERIDLFDESRGMGTRETLDM